MSVDQATVRRVAKLARIKVKEENVERLAGELNSILHWIEQLDVVIQSRQIIAGDHVWGRSDLDRLF